MRYIENPYQCPVTRTISIIGGKWKPIILNCIVDKTLRFGKLNQLIPAISNKVLSGELKELEELGLVKRRVFDDFPKRVEYSLSKSGQSLLPLLHELARWGDTHIARKLESLMR